MTSSEVGRGQIELRRDHPLCRIDGIGIEPEDNELMCRNKRVTPLYGA